MPMGQSGGRSANNPDGVTPRRRNTQRERAGIDPPFEHRVPPVREDPEFLVLTRRGELVLWMLGWGAWVAFCVLMSIVFCAWWGLL